MLFSLGPMLLLCTLCVGCAVPPSALNELCLFRRQLHRNKVVCKPKGDNFVFAFSEHENALTSMPFLFCIVHT